MKAKLAIASLKDKATGKLPVTVQMAIGMKAMVLLNIATEADVDCPRIRPSDGHGNRNPCRIAGTGVMGTGTGEKKITCDIPIPFWWVMGL